MHEAAILCGGGQSSRPVNKKPAGTFPAGFGKK
jgi:hypothetical protein